ncbi:MAG: DUF433 domain-containing protein, partial [Saprospiraceae bacterium]
MTSQNVLQRITMDPDICFGKPVIRGMRYPVEFILELLSSGMSPEEILEDYPSLEKEDIVACLLFAT